MAGSPDRFELLDDDAYYYLGVAKHVVAGDGFTFNGLDHTNGFHPLWLAALLPVEAVSAGRSETVLMVLVVQSALWILTVRELWLTGRSLGNPAIVLLAALPLAFFATANYRLAFNGMESGLVILFLAALLREVVRWTRAEPRPLRAGLLLAGLSLARLDAVFVAVGVVVVAWACWSEVPDRPRRIAQLAAPVVAGIGAFVVIDLIGFGTLTPVSGQAKSLGAPFHNLLAARDFLAMGSLGGHRLWTGVAALAVALWALERARGAPRGTPVFMLRALLLALLLAQGLFALYLVAMTSWPTWPWYFYLLPFVWLCALLILGLESVPHRTAERLAPALACLLVLVCAGFVAGWVRDPTYRSRSVAAAQALDAVAPRGAAVAMGDRAGAFSFGTERPVIQLEGLVESPAYLDALEDGEVPRFLRARRVAFYAASGEDGVPVSVGGRRCRAFAEPSNGDGPKTRIVVCDRDLVSDLDLGSWGRLRIWRYRPGTPR